jgi:MFS family permease
MVFAVFGLFWGAWSAVLPAVQQRTGLEDGRLGVALGAIALAAVPTMPLAGRVVDRVGARRALPACLAAFALSVPLAAFADGFASLVAALVVLGAATGALDVIANAAVAGWERTEGRPLMMLAHGSFSVGVLAGGALAGLAREHGASPLQVLGCCALEGLVVLALQPRYRRAPAHHDSPDHHLPRGSFVLLGLGVLTAAAFFAEDAMQSWSALHLERELGATPAISGLGPAVFAGAMAVGRLSGAALVRRVSERFLLSAFGAVLALGAAVVGVADSSGLALVGFAVAGLGTSVLAPVLYSAVGKRSAPGQQGADLATVTALGYVGFVAGPPAVGALSAAVSLPFALGALSALGLVLCLGGPVVLRSSGAPAPGSRQAGSSAGLQDGVVDADPRV